jgi:hypothetical protein
VCPILERGRITQYKNFSFKDKAKNIKGLCGPGAFSWRRKTFNFSKMFYYLSFIDYPGDIKK